MTERASDAPHGSRSSRVVSLNCSNTEIVCALGAESSLVGVDSDSDFPVDVVARLPRVGRDLEIDVAKVVALRPDLVLASLTVPGHEKVVEQLERARLPFLAPETVSLADVHADVRAIAKALGVSERGEEIVARMRQAITVLASVEDDEAGGSLRRPRILVEWWPRPVIAPGARSWVTELIDAAGGVNPIGDEPVKSRPIDDAEVEALAPDAIVVSWCGVPFEKYRADVVTSRERWRRTPAVANGQVHLVPEAFLGRPGPRLVDGFRALERVVASARAARTARVVPRSTAK